MGSPSVRTPVSHTQLIHRYRSTRLVSHRRNSPGVLTPAHSVHPLHPLANHCEAQGCSEVPSLPGCTSLVLFRLYLFPEVLIHFSGIHAAL